MANAKKRNEKAKDNKSSESSSSVDEQVGFNRARSALDPPSAALVEGLRLLLSDAEARDLGTESRADEVIVEARRTLLGATAAIRAHGAKLKYSAGRLRYAMELVHSLEIALAAQSETHGARRRVSSRRRDAESVAADERKELIATLSPVAKAVKNGVEDFRLARGNVSNGTDVGDSLDALVTLGEKWLGNTTPASVAMFAEVGLTQAMLDSARAVSKELRAARDETAEKGGRASTDSAETNAIEGRLLFELGALYDAVSTNRKDLGVDLPKLGAVTRRVLRLQQGAAKRGDAPPVS